MYDIVTNSHIALPDSPFAGSCHGMIQNGYFYAIVNDYSRILYRISLSRPTQWESLIELEGTKIYKMLTDGNHLYFIDLYIDIKVFDPDTMRVTTLQEQPFWPVRDLSNMSTLLIDKKIYILQPCNNREFDSVVDPANNMLIFDIATQSWSQVFYRFSSPYDVLELAFDRWIIATVDIRSVGK